MKLGRMFYTFELPQLSVSKRQILWLIMLQFLVVTATNLIALGASFAPLPDHSFITNNLYSLAIFAFIEVLDLIYIRYLLKRYQLQWKELGWRIPSRRRVLFWTLFVNFGILLGIGYLIYSGLNGKSPVPIEGAVTSERLVKLALDLGSYAVIVPLIEEIIFRGIIFTVLRRRFNLFWAWLLQALVFGISHIWVGTPVDAFIKGLWWGLVYCTTGSLVPGTIAHILNNGLVSYVDFAKNYPPLPESVIEKFVNWLLQLI